MENISKESASDFSFATKTLTQYATDRNRGLVFFNLDEKFAFRMSTRAKLNAEIKFQLFKVSAKRTPSNLKFKFR